MFRRSRVALCAWAAALACVGCVAASASTASKTTIVPGASIGGVSLGERKAAVRAVYGEPDTSGVSEWGLDTDMWSWAKPGKYDPKAPWDQLQVTYAQNGNTPGPVTEVTVPAGWSAWSIPGTSFVVGRRGNLAVLRRLYGSRLLGPFVPVLPGGVDPGTERYYELVGRLHGRLVHTLFRNAEPPNDATTIGAVSVSYCGSSKPGSMAPDDQLCHTR